MVNEEDFVDIADYIPQIKKLCAELNTGDCAGFYCERIKDSNNIVIYIDNEQIGQTYNIICSDTVTFSGTIGVNEVEKDGGISCHLDYLKLFVDTQKLPSLGTGIKTSDVDFSDEKSVTEMYIKFYTKLKKYFETSPIAMYSLMSGIKKVYQLPNKGIVITPSSHSFVDFSNFKDVNLINKSSTSFKYELSETTPNLKIYYEGSKLMHLRTKVDYKSKKFRLRFMMETGKNFFSIFEKLTEK